MKKRRTFLLITLFGILILGGSGLLAFHFYRQHDPITILPTDQLPVTIERFNPVPMVLSWHKKDKTIYYFNWGLQNNGGYELKPAGLDGHIIKIVASSPAPDVLTSQALTYPRLIVALPKGDYSYQVYDRNGKKIRDVFKPEHRPWRFTLVIPEEDRLATRVVWRDPYLGNDGYTKAEVALRALFSQDELMEFADLGIRVDRIVPEPKRNQWLVTLSPEFKTIGWSEQDLLKQAINGTLLALKEPGLTSVAFSIE